MRAVALPLSSTPAVHLLVRQRSTGTVRNTEVTRSSQQQRTCRLTPQVPASARVLCSRAEVMLHSVCTPERKTNRVVVPKPVGNAVSPNNGPYRADLKAQLAISICLQIPTGEWTNRPKCHLACVGGHALDAQLCRAVRGKHCHCDTALMRLSYCKRSFRISAGILRRTSWFDSARHSGHHRPSRVAHGMRGTTDASNPFNAQLVAFLQVIPRWADLR